LRVSQYVDTGAGRSAVKIVPLRADHANRSEAAVVDGDRRVGDRHEQGSNAE
jgi:hypothetical protein